MFTVFTAVTPFHSFKLSKIDYYEWNRPTARQKTNQGTDQQTDQLMLIEKPLAARPICRLRPLDAVLSSGLCGKEGALPPVTGLTVQRIICC